VTVLVPVYAEQVEKRYRAEFSTATPDLLKGREWVLHCLRLHHVDCSPVQEQLHYTIEATACYHFPVLRAWGGRPAVVNPNLIKAGARKTDKIDSLSLAEMDLAGRWPTSYLYPDAQMAVRVLLRLHRKYARLATLFPKSLNSQLLKFGVCLSRLGSLQASDVRPLVEDYLAGRDLLTPAAQDCLPELRLPDCLAQPLTALYDLSDAFRLQARQLWALLEEQLAQTAYWTGTGLLPGPQARHLVESVPGVGAMTSAWLLAEVGDVRRFPTANSLVAWAGCDLSLRISAGKVTSFTRRRGHSHIHWLLVQGAQRVLRGQSLLGQWGRGRVRKGGKGAKQRAVGAIARRLAEGAYYVLLRGQEWKASKALEEVMRVEEERQRGETSPLRNRPTGSAGDAGEVPEGDLS
jgi:transposase